jgi:hypothetical protein
MTSAINCFRWSQITSVGHRYLLNHVHCSRRATWSARPLCSLAISNHLVAGLIIVRHLNLNVLGLPLSVTSIEYAPIVSVCNVFQESLRLPEVVVHRIPSTMSYLSDMWGTFCTYTAQCCACHSSKQCWP